MTQYSHFSKDYRSNACCLTKTHNTLSSLSISYSPRKDSVRMQHFHMMCVCVCFDILLATLPPFIVYSFFHILEYAETELIPTLYPDRNQLQTRINEFRTKYYEQAMDLTSRYEVCGIMGLLLLGFFV